MPSKRFMYLFLKFMEYLRGQKFTNAPFFRQFVPIISEFVPSVLSFFDFIKFNHDFMDVPNRSEIGTNALKKVHNT